MQPCLELAICYRPAQPRPDANPAAHLGLRCLVPSSIFLLLDLRVVEVWSKGVPQSGRRLHTSRPKASSHGSRPRDHLLAGHALFLRQAEKELRPDLESLLMSIEGSSVCQSPRKMPCGRIRGHGSRRARRRGDACATRRPIFALNPRRALPNAARCSHASGAAGCQGRVTVPLLHSQPAAAPSQPSRTPTAVGQGIRRAIARLCRS